MSFRVDGDEKFQQKINDEVSFSQFSPLFLRYVVKATHAHIIIGPRG